MVRREDAHATVTDDEWITGDNARMDRWMVGWLDGWMDRWMDRWMDGASEVTPESRIDLRILSDDGRIRKLEKMDALIFKTIKLILYSCTHFKRIYRNISKDFIIY